MKGTFYICWGESGGLRFENGKYIKRLVLWRVAFAYLKLDIETIMEVACDITKEKHENQV